tara:strand:+ start:7955 stop:8152 length:198 start_codon:yes stop_codon:yes gene_type:complete
METVRADIGMGPGITYLIVLIVAVLAMWRWDMRRTRRKQQQRMREEELMRQHQSFLHGDGQGIKQ